jgi:2-methylcitrate dehydratase PrpD
MVSIARQTELVLTLIRLSIRHITSTTGSIGAAVAVSKLLSLSIPQSSHAIGIAATQVTGFREMFGADTKSFHPGRAAQSGLMAAVLAQRGHTSSEQALEAKRGWANVVGAGKEGVQESLCKWLGVGIASQQHKVALAGAAESGRWEIDGNSFKPYPCGIVIHPVIDGCCRVHFEMKQLGLEVRNVKCLHATVHPLVLELTGKMAPKNGLEGKFSFYHGAAIGLLYGKATPSEYEDHIVQEPSVIAIRDRIQGTTDSSLRADETRIVLTMNDGRVLETHVQHAVGSLDVPMDEKALERKFKDQCRAVLDDVDSASQACWEIENTEDVSEIVKILCPSR